MQKLLTIYKFNFPFIIEEFEEIKYDSILEDLEKLFLYEEEFKSKKTTTQSNFTTTTFKLKNYKAEIITYKQTKHPSTKGFNPLNNKVFNSKDNINKNNYFIPRLKFNFYSTKESNKQILKSIFEIFISTWRNNYIFDYNEKEISFKNTDQILTPNILKISLDKYSSTYLSNFLKNTPKEYIWDNIMNNKILRNSFYYIIYLCFEFYDNLLKTKDWKKEINNILRKQNKIENSFILKLSEKRLNIIEKDLLTNFINYKKILDTLFSLLK